MKDDRGDLLMLVAMVISMAMMTASAAIIREHETTTFEIATIKRKKLRSATQQAARCKNKNCDALMKMMMRMMINSAVLTCVAR